MLEREQVLVLRRWPLGETSWILSMLSAAHGKLRLVARGARSPRARLGAALDLGNELEIVYTLREGRELGHLREARLEHASLGQGASLLRMGVALAALELLDRVLPVGGGGDPRLYAALRQHLAAVEGAGDDRRAAVLLFYGFGFRALEVLGVGPELSACRQCGQPLDGGFHLDVDAASAVCAACRAPGSREGHGGGTPVSPATGRLLQALRRDPHAVPGGAETASPRRELGWVLHRLLARHLEGYRWPRALDLLRSPPAAAARAAAREQRPVASPAVDRSAPPSAGDLPTLTPPETL